MPLIQPTVTPTPTGTNLKGKTAIVTGANAGMGLETARQLLVLHASTVILACRNLSKAEKAKSLLLQDPAVQRHNPEAEVKVLQLDMDDTTSVKDFASTVKASVPIVNLLVLNAGLGFLTQAQFSSSGHERTIQINYLSNVLLILELLPHLEASATKTGTASRITWVGSRTQYESALPSKSPVQANETVFGHMDDRSKYLPLKRYADSKLLCAMFLHSVAPRVDKDKVLINMMCPGMVATDMSDNLPFHLRAVANLLKAIRARPVEQGGWLIIHSAAVAGPESHGKFVLDKDIQP